MKACYPREVLSISSEEIIWEVKMKFARIAVALVLSVLGVFAAGAAAAGEPPPMTHNTISEMTHN
jgi:hypothetical protein